MREKLIALGAAGIILFSVAGMAKASLINIGTATYNGSDYNLIWENNNNGNSLIWLDYTGFDTLSNWQGWAAGLDSNIDWNLSIDSAYHVTWNDSAWRLPTTNGGSDEYSPTLGYDGTTVAGYNISTSEMGYLFYTELGNFGQFDTSGNSRSDYGLTNTSVFDNLIAGQYFSSTRSAHMPHGIWMFDMVDGNQFEGYYETWNYHDTFFRALAVRSGEVSIASPSPVPEPATFLLFGSGLAGLAFYRRKRE